MKNFVKAKQRITPFNLTNFLQKIFKTLIYWIWDFQIYDLRPKLVGILGKILGRSIHNVFCISSGRIHFDCGCIGTSAIMGTLRDLQNACKRIYKCKCLENSDKCILHRVVFFRKSRVLSGPTMNGDQKIHAKNWNGSKKWLIKKLTKCWMKTLPNKVLSFTQFLNLSVLVVRS